MSTRPTFLGQGSYGCVFSPPPKCRGDEKRFGKNYISKVFLHDPSFREEKDLYENIVNKVDPQHKFTPAIAANCTVNSDSVNDSQCNFSINGLNQLIMENKGVELNQYIKSELLHEKKYPVLLQNMLPLIEGVLSMHKRDYVHHDIKPGNVLFHPDTNQVTLIDFGLLIAKGQVYTKSQMYKHCHAYIYYPPEFNIVCSVRNNYPINFSQLNSSLNAYVIEKLIPRNGRLESTAIFKYLQAKLQKDLKKEELYDVLNSFHWRTRTSQLKDFYKDWQRTIKAPNAGNPNQDVILEATKALRMEDKVDVYMLGSMLLQTLFISLEREMTSLRKRDYMDFANHGPLYTGFLRLIVKCIHPNPILRISIEDLAKEYLSLLVSTGHIQPSVSKPVKERKRPVPKKKTPSVEQAARIPLPEDLPPVDHEKPLEKRTIKELAALLAVSGIKIPKQSKKQQYIDAIKNNEQKKEGSKKNNENTRIWNPVRKEYVSVHSRSGKILTNPLNKRCKHDKVINPTTNRCVTVTGRVIKPLLKNST